jgi:hypothetical protein
MRAVRARGWSGPSNGRDAEPFQFVPWMLDWASALELGLGGRKCPGQGCRLAKMSYYKYRVNYTQMTKKALVNDHIFGSS